jgi:ATP-dependent Clp protease ATP-binding subunit ClpC
MGFATGNKIAAVERESKQVIETQLKKFFSPEFLNRVDDVVVFNSLSKEDIIQVLDIRMVKMLARISDLGYKVSLTKAAKEWLATKGFDAEFGARPLQRALQKYLEEPLAEEILKGNVKEGSEIKVDHKKDAEELKISVAKPKEKITE